MNNWRLDVPAVAVAVVFAVWSGPGYAGVKAEPDSLTLNSPTQPVTVKLLSDNAPIPASGITSWRLLASGHDYNEMFKFAKSDGLLTLTPTERIEVGSYDLVIDTIAGKVTVKVYTPLTDMQSVLEQKAAAKGVSIDEIKKELGLAATGLRETLTITLPPVYYEGQVLNISVPMSPGRVYTWTMNGKVLKQGLEENTLICVLKESGDCIITLAETEGGATIAAATAHTTVAPAPAIPLEVRPGVRIALQGPDGYGAYAWRVDNKVVATGATLTQVFPKPGHYVVECLASAPAQGLKDAFFRVRYDATVTSGKK